MNHLPTPFIHNHHTLPSSILNKLIQTLQNRLIFLQPTHMSHAIITLPLPIWTRCNLWLTRPSLLHSMERMYIRPYNNPRLTPKNYQMGKVSHTHQSHLHYNYYHHTQWLYKQSNQPSSTTACNSYTYHPNPHFTIYQNITLPHILLQ